MEIGEDGPERTELRMMYRLLTEIRRHWKSNSGGDGEQIFQLVFNAVSLRCMWVIPV